jgi:uncharacterized protein (TIGR02145 family)
MKKSFQRVIATLNLFQGKQSLTICLLAAFFALSACDDSSSAGDDETEVLSSSIESSSGVTLSPSTSSGQAPESAESNGSSGEKDMPSSSKNSDGSSGSNDDDGYSSESKKSNSSSSSCIIASSSGTKQISWPVGVKPSGYYAENCPSDLNCKDATSSTEYLNQKMLAAGEYGEMLDTRDGQVYKVVTIGEQTWMAQNLNYRYVGVKFFEGYVAESDSTSWCYDNDPANCAKYGRLYTWSAVMDSAAQFSVNAETRCGYKKICTPNTPHRGICPEGWHVPTNAEYRTLFNYTYKDFTGNRYERGDSTAGVLLKSSTGWLNSGNGTDKYGFSALPAGVRRLENDNIRGNFRSESEYVGFWPASEMNKERTYSKSFWSNRDYVDNQDQSETFKYLGHALRCLKDSD